MFSKIPSSLHKIIKDYYFGPQAYWKNKFSQVVRDIEYFQGESPISKAYYILTCEHIPLPVYL